MVARNVFVFVGQRATNGSPYGSLKLWGTRRERRPRRSEINNYSFIRTLPILSPTGSSFAKGAYATGYCFVGLL